MITALKKILATAFLMLIGVQMVMASGMINFGPSKSFIDIDVHAIAGGSAVFQNYKSSFQEIKNLDSSVGLSGGLGARATLGLREYLGLTTEANFLMRNFDMNMVVGSLSSGSLSGVKLDNDIYVVNIPVAMTLRLDVSGKVKWQIDFGGYYSYGIYGRQKQDIFVASTNALGELVTVQSHVKTNYFNSKSTFLNSFRRSDYGIHIATFLDFGPHLRVGARVQFGLKNVSYTRGIVNPSVHNLDFGGSVGYRF